MVRAREARPPFRSQMSITYTKGSPVQDAGAGAPAIAMGPERAPRHAALITLPDAHPIQRHSLAALDGVHVLGLKTFAALIMCKRIIIASAATKGYNSGNSLGGEGTYGAHDANTRNHSLRAVNSNSNCRMRPRFRGTCNAAEHFSGIVCTRECGQGLLPRNRVGRFCGWWCKRRGERLVARVLHNSLGEGRRFSPVCREARN